MQGIINNRLVGTIILVIAAIILLPSILDGEKQGTSQRFKTIPKQPELQPIEAAPEFDSSEIDSRFAEINKQEENIHAVDDTEMASVAAQTEEDIANTQAADTPAPTLTTDTVQVTKIKKANTFIDADKSASTDINPTTNNESTSVRQKPANAQFEKEAWVVQLGAFRNEANVQTLKSKLNKAGYVVITKKISVKTGMLTKVYVGPELDKTVLEKALPQLTKLTKLAGKITKYQP